MQMKSGQNSIEKKEVLKMTESNLKDKHHPHAKRLIRNDEDAKNFKKKKTSSILEENQSHFRKYQNSN